MLGFSTRRYALCALLSACAMPAAAQEAQDSVVESGAGKRQYKPEFFASYGPVTAYDMIQRIPGFRIEGSEGLRGFGENAGNVLIDGDRPSTKTDDIFTILQRIPASQVAYIELTEAAGADGDAAGKGQVANVVRKASNSVSGTYAVGALIGFKRGFHPAGNASATFKRGATTFEANIGRDVEWTRGTGDELFRDGNGALVERRVYDGFGGFNSLTGGGAIRSRVGDVKLNLNGKVSYYDGVDDRDGVLFNAAGVQVGTEELRTFGPDGDLQWEIGGDIEYPATAKLTSKLIGLYRSGEEKFASSVETFRTGQPTTLFITSNNYDVKEGVLRLQNDWNGLAGHQVQFGGEYAYNELSSSFFASSSTGGVVTPFPPADVLVQENRFEPFVSDVWTISPQWKLEAGVIAEFSKLRVTGDNNAERSFQFIKPRLVATWTLNKNTTFEFRADRSVAQLDFGEFATSADIGTGGQIDAGNADLVPEKVTNLSALVRHKFLDRGSVQLRASYLFVEDTQDLVLIEVKDQFGNVTDRFDGAGNIGSSRRWNLEGDLTLPLDWATKALGIKGMELKYTGHLHESSVTDPVTGEKRRRSQNPWWHMNWALRHDISSVGITYGVGIAIQAPGEAYFFNQYRRQQMKSDIDFFIEYKKFKWGTLKLELNNLSGRQFDRDRFYYQGTRDSGILTQIINRERYIDRSLVLSLSGKF